MPSDTERYDSQVLSQVRSEQDRLVDHPHSVHRQASAATAALNSGRPFLAEIHSDGTRYQLWVDSTDRAMDTAGGLPPMRLLVVLVNFRVAWHFSDASDPTYVMEKLRGTSIWDATVVSLFVQTVFRYLKGAARDL